MSDSAPHVARCRRPRLPPRKPRTSAEPLDLVAHSRDAAHVEGRADEVAFPVDEAEWAWLLSCGSTVLPVGAQSSVTGGATPQGGIVATTSGSRQVIARGADFVRVEAGLTIAALQNEAAARRLFYPPAPTHAGAFVGGTVATNASGAATFKYGTTRRWVKGLTVVLPGGDVLDVERGACRASDEGHFDIVRTDGTTARAAVPTYRMPVVPKCSAGYFAAPGMDLVDLFVGAEGTLGVVTEVELGLLPQDFEECAVLAFFEDASRGLSLVRALREDSLRTWAEGGRRGVDCSAIEHLDARTLALLHEHGVHGKLGLPLRPAHELALLVLVELPLGTSAGEAEDQIASLDEPGESRPLALLGRRLREAGGLDDAVVALPGDARRLADFRAFRESAPETVNALVGRAKQDDPGVRKVGGDVIVPFARFEELVALCREVPARRGLDVATWGHASDGNLHPNVLPRTREDVVAGQEALLEIGREVIRMGGSPMAEHGVGRHPGKQRLLREMVGDEGLREMQAVKRALDPQGVLAPGVLWP